MLSPQLDNLAPLATLVFIERANTRLDEAAEISPRHSAAINLAATAVNSPNPMRVERNFGLLFKEHNTAWHRSAALGMSKLKQAGFWCHRANINGLVNRTLRAVVSA